MTADAPRPRLGLIAGTFVALAAVFAVVQPLPHLPDEAAHLQYIEFLATRHRLPVWEPRGGEAGYESQHPPFSHLLYVPAWLVLNPLGRLVQVQGLRFAAVLVGLGWILLCWRLFGQVYGPESRRAQVATATVAWMPLTLLYACHPNPDLVVALTATAALGLSWRQLREGPDPRRAAWLGAALAAAFLTKLSGLAATAPWLLAALLAARRASGPERRAVARDTLLTAAVFVLLVAPYLGRNLALYGRPVVKTAAPYGSALDHVAAGHLTVGQLLELTAVQTYLSTWTQPDWIPGWPWRVPGGPALPRFPVILSYGAITVFLAAGLIGLKRAPPEAPERDFLVLGAALLAGVLAGQQAAFWTQDIEFNMGGRYVLSAMTVLAAVFAGGLVRPGGGRWAGAWLGLLLVLNLVAVATITLLLNPYYHPGWRILTLR